MEGFNNSAPMDQGRAARFKAAVVTAVVILVLFGLYWGSKGLLNFPQEAAAPACENEYTDIKEAVRNSESACRLDVSNKNLFSLTVGISHIKALTFFDASNNKIKELPAWIGSLTELEHLNLSNNRLIELPGEIGALQKLEVLDIRENPLSESEVEKVKQLLPDAEVKF